MYRLIQYFKNRLVRKHMQNRINEWLLSERAQEGFPIAAILVKH
jgi:hypothetical protein